MGFDGHLIQIPCPACKSPNRFVFHDDYCGGVFARCSISACNWIGDAFQFYMRNAGITDAHAAIAALKAAKVKIPKACERNQSIRTYKRHVESFDALRNFHDHMSRRRLSSVGGQPVRAAGCAISPHEVPYWWCTTLLELKHHLTGHVHSESGHGWSDLNSLVDSPEAPIVVLPYYDSAYRVVGIEVVGEHESNHYAGHSMVSGVAFRHALKRKVLESWNNRWVVSTNVEDSVAVIAAAVRDHGELYPLSLTHDCGSQDTRRALRSMCNADAFVVWPGQHAAAISSREILLARRLNAPIAIRGAYLSDAVSTDTVRFIAHHVIAAAVPWLEALEKVVDAKSDWSARQVVSDVGWCPRTMAKAKNQWKPATFDRVQTLLNTTAWRDIEITPDLVVTEAEDGLVNVKNGKLLYQALPEVERVYRGDDGRTRYAGKITFMGTSYAFDSATFMRNPLAVIDAVLLRANCAPPAPHPSIVPHLAAIARYRSPLE